MVFPRPASARGAIIGRGGLTRVQISANGLLLEVEDHGSPSGEPLLLIMGLGMQLVAWHEDFVASLVARGFRVIRFDNRDIGLSQGFDALGLPNLALESIRYTFGMKVHSPYTLPDMAADAVGILDALGIARAHVCGASMGGMIAQQMAIRHPGRVKSLTLMMTTSGSRRLPKPSLKVRGALLSRPRNPNDIDSVIAHFVRLYKLIGSPAYPPTDAYLKERLGMSVRRSYRPQGTVRQLVAIAADGDRSALLGRIKLPTQVVHGRDDPLVPVPAGLDLAERIAGARVDVIDGMGHDLPPALWPRFVADIEAAAGRA
jgi:pimeloyl-ACP methyl ester carboxylesterase